MNYREFFSEQTANHLCQMLVSKVSLSINHEKSINTQRYMVSGDAAEEAPMSVERCIEQPSDNDHRLD